VILALASDHAGFELKEDLKRFLADLKVEVKDFGPRDDASVDYPDFGSQVAQAVAVGVVQGGVLVDGSGIGMSIVANKYPKVRAALVSSVYAARMAKRHMGANVLCLSGWFTGKGEAREMVRTWVETEFEGGRHQRRLDKIREIEERVKTE